MYIIKVNGEIKIISGTHYCQDLSCKSFGGETNNGSYIFNPESHYIKGTDTWITVEGDLILTDKMKAIPYALYYTEKGIVVYNNADSYIGGGYNTSFCYYNDSINYIHSILDKTIDSNALSEIVYRSLFIDLWSILELLLCDLLLCMMYIYDDVHDLARKYYIRKITHGNKTEIKNLAKAEREYFFDKIVYHRFGEVGRMYKNILGVDMPNIADVASYIHTRHNIVHRHSLSNIDRMQVSTISRDDVNKFLNDIENFVKELKSRVDQKYKDRK